MLYGKLINGLMSVADVPEQDVNLYLSDGYYPIKEYSVPDNVGELEEVIPQYTEKDGVIECTFVVQTSVEKVQKKMNEIIKTLSDSDYKIIKCYEMQLVGITALSDLPYDVIALHAERQKLRDEYNELEQKLVAV